MMREGALEREAGMILINVLMFVAIASGLVLLMIEREEVALDRALRTREAARALAVVRGGELSALTALARDAVQSPEADYRTEAWGALAERGTAIEGGRFDLAVADAQGRFNVNVLRIGEAADALLFARIGLAAGLDEQQVALAIALVRERGPLPDLRPIAAAGLPPEVVTRLQAMVTALPGTTAINLNAVGAELLAVLVDDPAKAAALIALRDRQGFLSRDDLTANEVVQPPGTGFRSDTFWVRTAATIGGTRQQGATLIQRVQTDAGRQTLPVARWRNAAIPAEAPRF